MATSDDYRACVILNRDGEMRRASVKYVRLQDRLQALQKLREDKAGCRASEMIEAYAYYQHQMRKPKQP